MTKNWPNTLLLLRAMYIAAVIAAVVLIIIRFIPYGTEAIFELVFICGPVGLVALAIWIDWRTKQKERT